MTTAGKDVQTAIVLQGGGALGAYEYGVLRALYEQRPGFRPVAVAGVSIGAITAAVLGGARTDPISALDALWRAKLTVSAPTGPLGLPAQVDRSLALLGNPGMYQLRAGLFTTPWLLTSFYDTAPLRQTLAELVDPARLNADDPRVIVGATNVGTGEMEFFDRDRPGGLTSEHVAASGSLPPSFPMTDIDGEPYWDGGLFSNTPLGPAINALEQAADGDRTVERELIVVELFPMRAAVPQTMQDVVQRMMQLQYTSRLTLDARFFDKISRIVDLVDRVDATCRRTATSATTRPTGRSGRTAGSITSTSSPRACPRSCPTPRTSRGRRWRPGSGRGTTTRSRRGSAARGRRACGSG